jgi:hypothetical protein
MILVRKKGGQQTATFSYQHIDRGNASRNAQSYKKSPASARLSLMASSMQPLEDVRLNKKTHEKRA